MPVARLTLELEIHQAHSLKDRRQVVRSLKDSLRRGFNASVAEMDGPLLHNRATVGVAAISPSRSYLEGQMREIERAAHRICNGLGATISEAWGDLLDDISADPYTDPYPQDGREPGHEPGHSPGDPDEDEGGTCRSA